MHLSQKEEERKKKHQQQQNKQLQRKIHEEFLLSSGLSLGMLEKYCSTSHLLYRG